MLIAHAIGDNETFAKMIVLLLHYRNQQLWTPLDCAAHKGWVKTAYALLENDSTVDPTDKAKVMIFLSCISTKNY